MHPIVLASTSPYRRQLLERLALPFSCDAPGVDESAVKSAGGGPFELAAELARRKALAVAERHPGAVVIGGDQVATIDGEVLDKPGTAAAAAAQLQRLQGRQHTLVTAVAIAGPTAGALAEFLDVTRLLMRTLGSAEIERYVAADRPLDCAGSYRVEGLGISLFAAIDCEDQTAIVGLPLLRLCTELRQLGIAIP